jgi:hypothetical protein
MNFHRVIDPMETGSLTPHKFRINFFSRLRGVIDTAETISAGSMTPWKRFPRGSLTPLIWFPRGH